MKATTEKINSRICLLCTYPQWCTDNLCQIKYLYSIGGPAPMGLTEVTYVK